MLGSCSCEHRLVNPRRRNHGHAKRGGERAGTGGGGPGAAHRARRPDQGAARLGGAGGVRGARLPRHPGRAHRPARQGRLRVLLHLLPLQGGGLPGGRRPAVHGDDRARPGAARGPVARRSDTARQPLLLPGLPAQREDDGDRRAGRDVQRRVPGAAAQAPRRVRRADRQGDRALAAGGAGGRRPRSGDDRPRPGRDGRPLAVPVAGPGRGHPGDRTAPGHPGHPQHPGPRPAPAP